MTSDVEFDPTGTRGDVGRGALKFEGLDIGKFVDGQKLVVDLHAMIKTVANHSQRQDLKSPELLPELEALCDDGHDVWHVCCGHHLTEILALALRKTWATNNATALDASRIESMLRLAYEQAHFAATNLHAGIRAWEADHPPFVILR